MQFLVNGKKHTLKGLQPGSLSMIISHRMVNILKNNSHGAISQLHSIQMQPLVISTPPLALEQILDQYAHVFAELMGFPASRPYGHRILLLPGSIHSNIRPIPTRIWIDNSMSFIEGIPKYGGKTMILVVVDLLSKYSHFCALNHPYTTSSFTQIFMDQMFRNATFTCHF